MKEAAGEANMTVITIILIGVVVAVGVVLVPRLMGNTAAKACCTDAGGEWVGGDTPCTNFALPGGEEEYNDCVEEAA